MGENSSRCNSSVLGFLCSPLAFTFMNPAAILGCFRHLCKWKSTQHRKVRSSCTSINSFRVQDVSGWLSVVDLLRWHLQPIPLFNLWPQCDPARWWQGHRSLLRHSQTKAGETIQPPVGQITHDMLSSLAVTVPTFICHPFKPFQRFTRVRFKDLNEIRKRTEKWHPTSWWPCSRWWWLRGGRQLRHSPPFQVL